MRRIATILSWISGAFALFCLIAYGLTFVGQNLLAGLAGLAPCILFFLLAPLVWYGIRLGENNVMNYIKGWQRRIIAGLFLFVMLNFAWHAQQSEGGTPQYENGAYILSNHGTFIRELTEAEYKAMQLASLRLSSASPILFFTLAAFGWHGVIQRLQARDKGIF